MYKPTDVERIQLEMVAMGFIITHIQAMWMLTVLSDSVT